MNPSRQPPSRRKRQRAKLKIGIAKPLPPQRGANRIHEQNHGNQAEHQYQENARVIAPGKLRDGGDRHRNHHQVAENASHPGRDFLVLAQALCLPDGPIRPPQPWRGRVCFFDRGLLLHPAVAAHRDEQEARSNGRNKNRDGRSGNRAAGAVIAAIRKKRKQREEPRHEKHQPEKNEENSRAFGRFSHTSSLGSCAVEPNALEVLACSSSYNWHLGQEISGRRRSSVVREQERRPVGASTPGRPR